MIIPKAVKLPSGNWRIQLKLKGKSINVLKPTKAECERAALLIKAEYKNGIYKKTSDITVSEAIDLYIDKRSNVLSPSTIKGYRSIQRNYFQSIMNDKAAEIDLQRAVNEESKVHSAKTVKNAYGLIRAVISDAGIEVKEARLPQVVRNERPFLNPDEIKMFLEVIKGEECELAALLALHSLRRSEILALTSSDIKDGFIYVNKSAVEGEHGLVTKKTNKNSSSNRIIPVMIPRIYEIMPKGLLVTHSPDTLGKQINRVCRKHGLPEVGVHGLRHSFASLAYYMGLSELETMKIGGWSDKNTMHNIYTHVYDKSLERKTNRLTEFFND